jgi:hypothetical protein
MVFHGIIVCTVYRALQCMSYHLVFSVCSLTSRVRWRFWFEHIRWIAICINVWCSYVICFSYTTCWSGEREPGCLQVGDTLWISEAISVSHLYYDLLD